MHIILYMIALHLLLCNLQNFVYSFIDMDNSSNQKKKRKKKCKCKIDERLSLKMEGMLYMVRAALVRGLLSYITLISCGQEALKTKRLEEG